MMQKTPITQEQLTAWSAHYNASEARQIATLALSKASVFDAAYSPAAAFAMRQKFSIDIPTLPVANQKRSGRCWLFAALNVLRERFPGVVTPPEMAEAVKRWLENGIL